MAGILGRFMVEDVEEESGSPLSHQLTLTRVGVKRVRLTLLEGVVSPRVEQSMGLSHSLADACRRRANSEMSFGIEIQIGCLIALDGNQAA